MTREKAIEIIRKMLACTDLTVRANLNADMVDACHLAIKALEQEPKTGKWISTETKGVRYAFWCRYKCSLCGELSDHTNFCPNCGAKMVEPQESKENKNIN